jgi:hypothetical protein
MHSHIVKARMASMLLLALSCTGGTEDKAENTPAPSPYGDGIRIRAFQNPGSPDFMATNGPVRVTGAVVTHVDTFDETSDGKSIGAVYIQDAEIASLTLSDADHAYAGLSMFAPTFTPTDLRLSPGDVLDFRGAFIRYPAIGNAIFRVPEFLPQLTRAVGTIRFDHIQAPTPTLIDVNELTNFETGKKWIGLLVTVKNITILAPPCLDKGRVTSTIAGDSETANLPCKDWSKKVLPVISNELYDFKPEDFGAGKTYASITGICTYFLNLKIAPRSSTDLVAE